MELLCDLLFELSSGERMNIMLSLREQRLRLSHIAQRLEMTVTEASRQLQRLSDALLVSRDTEGLYGVTSYGELAITLLSNLEFISENRHYFLEHDVSNLPYEFINRISELSLGTLNTDIVRVLAHVDVMIQDAEEYIWIMSYAHALPSTVPIVEEKKKEGIKLRRIFPEDLKSSPVDMPILAGEIRTLPRVELRIIMTEKEAMYSLPLMEGKIDYTSFIGKDPKFHKWCRDTYQYYWERAKSSL